MRTILLLICSNVFMTAAWYWQLLRRGERSVGESIALPTLIVVSWLIALPEYALAVPANRLGHVGNGGPFSAAQLKILQEGISISVFLAFSVIALRETPRWQDVLAFALIGAGLTVALWSRGGAAA